MSAGLTPVSFRKPREHAPRLSEPYVPGRRHQRYWTEEENDILRQYYPSGGLAACAAHLPPHKSGRAAIYGQVSKLGVRRDARQGPRVVHDYGPEMDDAIRAAWPELDGYKRGAVHALADRLGVPRWWLGKRASKLGLDKVPYRKEPPWTAAENALMRQVPLHDPDRASEIFRQHGFARSPTAIVVRAKRLELSRRATRPTLSAARAAKILGMDGKTVATWCIAGELRATKRNDRRLPQQGGSSWDIERADLRRFVVERLERIDFRKVDKFALVDLLVGPAGTEAPVVAIASVSELAEAREPRTGFAQAGGEKARIQGKGIPEEPVAGGSSRSAEPVSRPAPPDHEPPPAVRRDERRSARWRPAERPRRQPRPRELRQARREARHG